MKWIGALVMVVFASSGFAKVVTESAYTSVKAENCVTIDSDTLWLEPEIDFYEGECPGLGGYRVKVVGGDLRYHLNLSYNGAEISTPSLPAFHDLGSEVIEWRYTRLSDEKEQTSNVKYQALIYRLNVSSYDENGNPKSKDLLVVVRLDGKKSCTLGMIEQQNKMNELARQLADNKSAKCLPLEE